MNGDGTTAKVTVGKNQHLLFRETDKPLPDYDEHHVQIYVVNFSGPHKRLGERGLVNREDNQYQYRFRDIADLDSGKHLFTIEHEVRSLTHPMCLRPLVNRNPAQTARNYSNGYDQNSWAMEPQHYDDQQQRRAAQMQQAVSAQRFPEHRNSGIAAGRPVAPWVHREDEMIDCYTWTTDNGYKPRMMLEETGLAAQDHSGQHPRKGADVAGLPEDQPRPQDSGDRRS